MEDIATDYMYVKNTGLMKSFYKMTINLNHDNDKTEHEKIHDATPPPK